MNTAKNEAQAAREKLSAEKIAKLFCITIIIAIAISYLLKAFTEVHYHEIDSYVLPTVSVQYRQTIIINQEDIDRARIDFPKYYEKVTDYDSLRCSQLTKITDDEWVAFYFPSYSIMCLPLKLLFQLLGIDQIRAFTVMNALFVIAALIYVYRKLNVSMVYKLFALLLFIVSPIYMYIGYVSAEAMMFSLITIALVMFSNKMYKTAALLIAVASMTNPTVMGIGIVMVLEYFVRMFINRKNVRIFSKDNILNTLKYGSCYLPCLIPFVFNLIVIGTGNPTSGGATLKDYGARVLSYFFDVNIGFFSFAPLTLCAFFVLLGIALKRRRFGSLVYAGFLVAPVLAYSLMIYINCVPTFCARYVMWTYPALFIGIVLLAEKIIPSGAVKYAFGGTLTAAAAVMVLINHIPRDYYGFNGMSTFLLENFPAAYSPYRAMFYAANDKFNWPFEIDSPSYYFSENDGNLRKLLFKATDEYKNEVLNSLNGSEASLEKFSEKINGIPSDGNFHYVNISPISDIKLKKKTLEDCGAFREDKTILRVDEPFTVCGSAVDFEVNLLPKNYYKLEIEFDGKLPSRINNTPFAFINDKYIMLGGFVRTDDNKYSKIYYEDGEYLKEINKLGFDFPENITIKSLRLTSMENLSTKSILDKPVSLSGGNAEDVVLIPVELKPLTYYVLNVKVSDKSAISQSDGIYCTIYYEKRFNHIIRDVQIVEEENKILMFSGDTTIATGPTYIIIFGKSENEIEIESVSIEYAQ